MTLSGDEKRPFPAQHIVCVDVILCEGKQSECYASIRLLTLTKACELKDL